MTGMRRSLLLLAALTAPLVPAFAAQEGSSDLEALFREGQELLRQGKKEEALDRFTRVLAANPSNEAAYELWKIADEDVLLDMLVEGGQYELVAARLLELSQLGMQARENAPERIKELLNQLESDDASARRQALRELAANHGEYAVPFMIDELGDPVDDDARVLYMHALTQMQTDVVLPLIATLESDDAFLRRNVALTLGYIGDRRAAPKLTWLARNDPDRSVQDAAREAAMKVGSDGNALALFLDMGDDYHAERATVLRPSDYSAVVWSWQDGQLTASEVPRYLYADELSKGAYYEALSIDPSSLDARAGVARAYASQQSEILTRGEAGGEVGAVQEQLDQATVALNVLGVEALDRALAWAVGAGDTATGVRLAHLLGQLALEPTPALRGALNQGGGAVSAQSAVALGEIAYRAGTAPSPAAVESLARAAGLEVQRVAVVIDGREDRGQVVARALREQGIVVHHWDSAARALSLLRRVPGVDAIVVADQLPDLTVDQVLRSIQRDDRLSGTPVLMLTENAEQASEVYGDQITDTITAPADVEKVVAAMEGNLNSDREQANRIAARAAGVLAQLAHGPGRQQIAAAAGPLAGTLASRPDEVVVPALHALASIGDPSHLEAVVAVISDAERSDEARVAAAEAAGSIAARTGAMPADAALQAMAGVLGSDASLDVRSAVSRALGRMELSPERRAALGRAARVDVSAAPGN